jgi:hypothetical protein
MPTAPQQENVTNAIIAIRSAQKLINKEINDSTTTSFAIKLANEYAELGSCLTHLLHAQNAADDAIFDTAASVLKSETSGLTVEEASIKGIITDVNTAQRVVDYITQALSFIAKL